MFLSSASSALLTLVHPYANTTIFTVLSWFGLNYHEVASLSLRIYLKTIVFLYVSSGISSCNSRTPVGREHSLERSCSVADGKYLPPACTCRGLVMECVCLGGRGVCACVKEGCRDPRSRCRGEAGWQQAHRPHRVALTEGAIWEGTRRNFVLNWEQIIVPGCMSCPVPSTLSVSL